jgi:hypothetical protein
MTVTTHRQDTAVRYRIYGHILSCNARLHELEQTLCPDSTEYTDLHIQFSSPDEPIPLSSSWYLTVSLTDGTPWLRCATHSLGYLLHFPNLADFVFDTSRSVIHCTPQAKTPTHTLHHLLLDQVLPLVLNYKGHEVLHGAAVVTPYGACAFVGPTGAGKSTLAASFLAAGYPVLTDDCVALSLRGEHILAIPAYPGIRLWDNAIAALFGTTGSCAPMAHYTSKQRFTAALSAVPFCFSAVPLVGVYVLGTAGDEDAGSVSTPTVSPLTEREALMTLLSLAFKLDIRDRRMLTREFDFLHRLVTHIPVRRLTVPDSFTALPAVQAAILHDLALSC